MINIEDLEISTPTAPLYHISFQEIPTHLKPQLPAGGDMESTESSISEPDIPRICFSTTLEGCVRAIFPNIVPHVVKYGRHGLTFHVYKVRDLKNVKRAVSPNALVERAVHDALVTNEWWVLDAVDVVHVGTVVVSMDYYSEFLCYRPYRTGSVREHSPRRITISKIVK